MVARSCPYIPSSFCDPLDGVQDEITSAILPLARLDVTVAPDLNVRRLCRILTNEFDRNVRASKKLSSTFYVIFSIESPELRPAGVLIGTTSVPSALDSTPRRFRNHDVHEPLVQEKPLSDERPEHQLDSSLRRVRFLRTTRSVSPPRANRASDGAGLKGSLPGGQAPAHACGYLPATA